MDLDDEELKATRRMNGSDKNVVCIEEDIKVLEEIKDMFIHLKNYGWINDIKKDIDTDKAIQAIEHLIKAYKEKEEENEELTENYNVLENEYITNSIPNFIVKEKIEEIDKEIEYQKLYGNVAKREKLETKKEHFLELLEGK